MNLKTASDSPRLTVSLANDEASVRACQRLRYRIFSEEMGARLSGPPGLDEDRFDAHCRHLMVVSETGEVVGTTRILLQSEAARCGGFYSQGEFDLTRVLALPGRFMELGRTCIHPDHRRGPALGLLWQGVLGLLSSQRVDYLIGCVSIPFGDTGAYPRAVMQYLRSRYLAPEYLRVYPSIPLPRVSAQEVEVVLPPLLKAYLKLGAVVCGEPYWDLAFNVADLFVLLERDRLNERYLRRFLARC